MSDGPVAAKVAWLMEVVEATIDVVGPDAVQAKLNQRKKERDLAKVLAEENDWKEKCAGKDAKEVKRLSATAYFFGKAPGDVPVAGPVAAIPEAERPAVIGGRVGAKYTIGGRPVVILSAYEETEPPDELEPAEGEAVAKPKAKRKGKAA